MFFIPGILIAFLTFPGVIVHELAHQLACRFVKVPVFKVCYFQSKNPNGYVIHDKPITFFQTVVISMGPFVVNSMIGLIIYLPGRFSVEQDLLEYFLMWLGISILMHAFPSQQDLKYVFAGLKEKTVPIFVKLLIFPVACLMMIGTVGSIVWLDLGYSLLVAKLAEIAILNL